MNQLLPTTVAPPAPKAPPAPSSPPGAAPTTAPPSAAAPPTTAVQAACPTTAQPAAGGRSGAGGSRSSAALVEALRRADGSDPKPAEAVMAGMGRFPVGGMAEYSDDWHAPRLTPCFHLHKGTDVFAARGTPVRAPADGVLRFSEEAVGGRSAYVTETDGTYYYMAHLDSFANLASGSRVSIGQVVGFVGDSGNAAGGTTHVHLQIHPRGGAPINPKPILDGWLDAAMVGISTRSAALSVSLPRPVAAIAGLRRFDTGATGGPMQTSALLWASTRGASGASLRLAELHLARIAAGVDWSVAAGSAQADAEARAQGQAAARALLWPLTPAVIVATLDPAR